MEKGTNRVKINRTDGTKRQTYSTAYKRASVSKEVV